TVKCWSERAPAPHAVPRLADAVEIVGSSQHACARRGTGKVSCWGLRALLGDGADSEWTSPLLVLGAAF
ncbi:MAG TPA: hypothetical protein VGM88_31620, partial [Kofleriaceae bacterium]